MQIQLVPHMSEWRQQFQGLKRSLETLLGEDLLTLDHFGSTAISGIKSKPVIDMIGTISHSKKIEEILKRDAPAHMESLGENGLAGRLYLVIYDAQRNVLAHVHLFGSESVDYRNRIAFRDHLRTNPLVAKEYETLKIDLALRFPNDPKAYWEGKTAFVNTILSGIGC